MEISEMIRDRRGSKTQEQFAKEVGCSRQSVVWWETGTFVPSREMLSKLGIKVTYEVER